MLTRPMKSSWLNVSLSQTAMWSSSGVKSVSMGFMGTLNSIAGWYQRGSSVLSRTGVFPSFWLPQRTTQ